jgi:hypothetical protein
VARAQHSAAAGCGAFAHLLLAALQRCVRLLLLRGAVGLSLGHRRLLLLVTLCPQHRLLGLALQPRLAHLRDLGLPVLVHFGQPGLLLLGIVRVDLSLAPREQALQRPAHEERRGEATT